MEPDVICVSSHLFEKTMGRTEVSVLPPLQLKGPFLIFSTFPFLCPVLAAPFTAPRPQHGQYQVLCFLCEFMLSSLLQVWALYDSAGSTWEPVRNAGSQSLSPKLLIKTCALATVAFRQSNYWGCPILEYP